MFLPLESKLKELTGHDVMAIDLTDRIQNLKTPCFFHVCNDDKLSTKKEVQSMFSSIRSKNGVIPSSSKADIDHRGVS